MNALFVCSRNQLRSPTAEAVFAAYPGVGTDSAGTAVDADVRVSADAIEWADVIFAMEPVHRKRLQSMFPKLLRNKRVVVLNIPDEYDYMDAALVRVLKERVPPHLRTSS